MKEWLASSFGLGKLPFAPGTWGSLPAVVLYQVLGFLAPGAAVYGMAALLVLFSWICVQCAPAVIRRTGRNDPQEVVADETAGQALTLLAVAWVFPVHICNTAVLGFALFRLFDITKPWPIRRLEKLPSGWGILADDLAAGVYAAAASILAIRLLPGIFG
jgi:phosphatidylglycerophosphatase A